MGLVRLTKFEVAEKQLALDLNLEEEAVNLIQRAIDNFQRLRPGPNAMFQRFEDEAAAWYSRFSEQIV